MEKETDDMTVTSTARETCIQALSLYKPVHRHSETKAKEKIRTGTRMGEKSLSGLGHRALLPIPKMKFL